ncbi:MAG: right-handed parallel beta-helix repeat-containing protein [Lentisphaeria bacterium]|nr:right-handed parallel beta-helix repeat-containing protein [Lentisphaeria bacterium]
MANPVLTILPVHVALLLGLASRGGVPTELFVAPHGSDQASGASLREPFATLSRARDEARGLRAAGRTPDGITIWVAGGTYALSETLAFGPEDAGTAEAPLVIQAAPGQQPVLRGGVELRGLVAAGGPVLRCDLDARALQDVSFRQLFFRGRRMPLARAPNQDADDIHGGRWAHVVEPRPRASNLTFAYSPKDVDPSRWARPGDGRIGVFCRYDWRWNWLPIREVDPVQRTLTVGRAATYAFEIGDRYFVEGIFEELDAPGEWYVDRPAATLHFWPPEPASPGDVVVPVVGDLVRLQDTRHVALRGFLLECCDGRAVWLQDAVRCDIAACVIRNCAQWGVSLNGGEGCSVTGCDIYATGCGGIALTGGNRATLTPAGHLAANNVVHHVGVFEKTYNTAINISGVGNAARNNLIHDTPHAGMTLAGNDNVVEFNIIHHTNLQSTDTGGLYSCPRDWTQRGNLIRHNIWHDLGGYGKRSSWEPVQDGKVVFEYPHFTWGIYMDDPTSGNTMYGNLLYRVPICGLFTHGGRDNVFENNILVDCPAFQMGMLTPDWSEWENVFAKFRAVTTGPEGQRFLERYPALREYDTRDGHPEAMIGHRFVRNIIYSTAAGTEWLRGEQQDAWKGSQRMMLMQVRLRQEDLPRNEVDYNTVYAEPGLEGFFRANLPPAASRDLSWEGWRELGVDRHSLWADPLFVDAPGGDFRLRPDSPALRLGFRPIPFERIGPYRDTLRASWPIVEDSPATARAKPLRQLVQLPGYEPLPAKELSVREGAGNAFSKLAAGGAVRIAYFGGGIHPAAGWRADLLAWLRRRYPAADIAEIDGGVCDCVRGSGFSLYRFEHDVLRLAPDLILVDFAADDHQTGALTIQRTVEALVRKAWRTNPDLDLVLLYAFRLGFEGAYARNECPTAVSAYERVAERYGIPSLNMGHAVAALNREGKLVLRGEAAQGQESFSADGTRPGPAGNRVYAEALGRGFAALATDARPKRHSLPAPWMADGFESARLIPIDPEMLSGEWRALPQSDPAWAPCRRHFDTLWFTNTPGAKLTFRFEGTECSLFDLMGPDTGQVRVTVDGKDLGTRRQVDPWAYFQRLAALPLAGNLVEGEHLVTVELLPDPPDRSVAITEARKLDRHEAADFQGVALRLGWIRAR